MDIVPRLHGHPLAARFAAKAWAEGRHQALDRIQFVRRVQESIVQVLISDVHLGPEEEKALKALCVFRRPVDESVLPNLPLQSVNDCVDALGDRFLVERTDGRVFVMPLIRDYAESEWLGTGGYDQFHEVAAKFYHAVYNASPPGRKFEAREEAIYHYAAIREFDVARSFGSDWQSEARAATQDASRRREWSACAEVCEKLLKVQGFSAEISGRAAVAYARMAKWREAKIHFESLTKRGAASCYGAG